MHDVQVPQPTAAAGLSTPAAAGVPYERDVPWFADRKAFRILVALLLLNIVAVTSLTWGPITARMAQDWLAARKAAEQQARADAAKAAADAATAAADRAARIRARDQQQAGLAFDMVGGRVVYTEEFVEAARLARDPAAGYLAIPQRVSASSAAAVVPHPPVVWNGSPELRAITATLPTNGAGGAAGTATVFLHERRAAGGPGRLVWVDVEARRDQSSGSDSYGRSYVTAETDRQLVVRVIEPGTADGDAHLLFAHRVDVPQARRMKVYTVGRSDKPGDDPVADLGDELRVMAGVPDPADPARLTIPYTYDGRPGVLGVVLGADDRTRIDPGRGATTVERFDASGATETWLPEAEPTSRPTSRPAARRPDRR